MTDHEKHDKAIFFLIRQQVSKFKSSFESNAFARRWKT